MHGFMKTLPDSDTICFFRVYNYMRKRQYN
jgi:hypothetical protein